MAYWYLHESHQMTKWWLRNTKSVERTEKYDMHAVRLLSIINSNYDHPK